MLRAVQQRPSTMQNELQEAADAGFDYRGQTVFKTAFGGEEVVVILEKDLDEESTYYAYKLLATKKNVHAAKGADRSRH